MSDALQLFKDIYQVTLLYVSGAQFQSSWIEFQSELAVEGATWGTIKNLYR